MHYDGVMSPLLKIENLYVRFAATEAVLGIALDIDEGEVLGLVGESGSGKSATALAIMGLLAPTAHASGEILWRGADGRTVNLLKMPPRAMRHLRGREIAMIFQEPMTALNPVMTIGRQVAESVAAHHPSLTGKDARRKAIEALEAGWFAPLLQALRGGRIGMVTLHVPDAGADFEVVRADLRRFWRRPRALERYA